MAGPRRGRTLESWNALTSGNRRRWIRAYGGSEDAALEAYRNGESLNAAQRGHATTPERPIQALLQPWKFPGYTGTHTAQLNEIARRRGLAEHGTGPRGESPLTRSYEEAGGDFTWVVPRGTLNPPDWRFNHVFRTEREAQLYARRSWAPAGVVIIQDNLWEKGEPQPFATTGVFRWEVWFGYNTGSGTKGRKKKRRKR